MKRREAREYAFKLVYELGVQTEKDAVSLIEDTAREQEFAPDGYIEKTVMGIAEKKDELDALIAENAFPDKEEFAFILNGELIRVGKSGTYSISDINVKTLGVVGNVTANPDNPIPFNEDSNYFLMDYQYIKEV